MPVSLARKRVQDQTLEPSLVVQLEGLPPLYL